jgi:hypothetical protein
VDEFGGRWAAEKFFTPAFAIYDKTTNYLHRMTCLQIIMVMTPAPPRPTYHLLLCTALRVSRMNTFPDLENGDLQNLALEFLRRTHLCTACTASDASTRHSLPSSPVLFLLALQNCAPKCPADVIEKSLLPLVIMAATDDVANVRIACAKAMSIVIPKLDKKEVESKLKPLLLKLQVKLSLLPVPCRSRAVLTGCIVLCALVSRRTAMWMWCTSVLWPSACVDSPSPHCGCGRVP